MKEFEIFRTWPITFIIALLMLSFQGFAQKDITQETALGEGSDGSAPPVFNFPDNFDLHAHYTTEIENLTFYWEDPWAGNQAYHCPGLTFQSVGETHDGLYRESKTRVKLKLWCTSDGNLFELYSYDETFDMSYAGTFGNIGLSDVPVPIAMTGVYNWYMKIDQRNWLGIWVNVCDEYTEDLYIIPHVEYLTKDYLLYSAEDYQYYATEEIYFNPGFEYAPSNSSYDLIAEIKDCSGGDNIVENDKESTDFKSSEIADNGGIVKKQIDLGDKGINIYPNPSKDGNFMIISNGTIIENLQVMNMSGDIIYTIEGLEALSTSLNLTSHEKGVYFVRVVLNDKVLTKKIVISN